MNFWNFLQDPQHDQINSQSNPLGPTYQAYINQMTQSPDQSSAVPPILLYKNRPVIYQRDIGDYVHEYWDHESQELMVLYRVRVKCLKHRGYDVTLPGGDPEKPIFVSKGVMEGDKITVNEGDHLLISLTSELGEHSIVHSAWNFKNYLRLNYFDKYDSLTISKRKGFFVLSTAFFFGIAFSNPSVRDFLEYLWLAIASYSPS